MTGKHSGAVLRWYYDRVHALNRKKRLRGITVGESAELARYRSRIDALEAEARPLVAHDALWAHIQKHWGETLRKLAE